MTNQPTHNIRNSRHLVFLLDVFSLALTAFGGPQIHFTMIHRKLVIKRKYITENELKELNSLCNMLPGPTSTQIITAIGYKMGGPMLAFLTLTVWVLPATLIMGAFAIILFVLELDNPKLHFLKYIQPMAVGFIIYAAYKIKDLFVTKSHHWVLMILSAIAAILSNTPYIFPLLLIMGGVVSNFVNRSNYADVKPIKNIQWGNFALFLGVFLAAAGLGAITKNTGFLIFENTYRYGSIVFGGGHVLIPMMYNQFVEFKHYLTSSEFLAGVGILQAIPGPVFSFATFTGSLALKDYGIMGMMAGGLIGTVAIFLPGILLIFFIYPMWNQIKHFSPVKNAIEGINATSAGLVIASAYLLFKPLEINEMNMLVMIGTLFILLTTKIPNPIIVIMCILAGLIF
ncbi:chromate transporter [Bacteroidetes bacterium UKL13-3]|nr:chromate transporter [Bacteroidetes bacterium UKL13-3]HCP92860.1 chromate transporter [Bacteroidota bacterium]